MLSDAAATANQKRLRANLKAYGWSQQRLADWLTSLGEPVTRKQIEGWLAKPGSTNYRCCPAWPSLLIEARNGKSAHRVWTDEQDAFLRTYYPKHGARYCAEHLGRTASACGVRAGVIGVSAPPQARWDQSHDAQLSRLHADGWLIREIARELGFSQQTVHRHAQRLGLKFLGRGRHFQKRRNHA